MIKCRNTTNYFCTEVELSLSKIFWGENFQRWNYRVEIFEGRIFAHNSTICQKELKISGSCFAYGNHWGFIFCMWVYNKKPSPRKIFVKNSFFSLFKQNYMYSLLTYSMSFLVICNVYEKMMVFKNCIAA